MMGTNAPSAAGGDRQLDHRIVVILDAEDLRELERILIDGDEKAALRFLHERIEKRVDATTQARMKLPFD